MWLQKEILGVTINLFHEGDKRQKVFEIHNTSQKINQEKESRDQKSLLILKSKQGAESFNAIYDTQERIKQEKESRKVMAH